MKVHGGSLRGRFRQGELEVYVECQWVLAKMAGLAVHFLRATVLQMVSSLWTCFLCFMVLTETLVFNGREAMGSISEWSGWILTVCILLFAALFPAGLCAWTHS